jgi:cell division protein FtsX
MIQSPLHALRARPMETAAVILLLAIACALPGTLLMGSTMGRQGLDRWLTSYEPIITLSLDATPAQIAALEAELKAVEGVGAVTPRSPADSLALAQARLGAEQAQALGLVPDVFPRSLIIRPDVPLQGHIALASALAGMEARDGVAAVDIPSPAALRALSTTRDLTVLALVLAALLLAAAIVLTSAFLARVEADQRRELELLELFGASRRDLARPTVWRALSIGATAGVLASAALLIAQVTLASAALTIFGVEAGGALTWWIVPLPMPLCAALAWAAAQSTRRRASDAPHAVPQTRSLLAYGMRTSAQGA